MSARLRYLSAFAFLLGASACGTSGSGKNNNSNHTMGNCGNGVVEDDEACDDGNQVDDLTCSADCQSYCGDGVLDQPLGEACDGADLGDGTTDDSTSLVDVVGLSGVTDICTGNAATCAVTTGGTVHCWGWSYFGQLGDGTTVDSSVPVTVLNIDNAVDVACGEVHTCAILADGTVRCWGENEVGSLGNGLDVDSSVPVHPLI